MDISLSKTRFIFLAPSRGTATERHVLDLLYGILLLLIKGVPKDNIILFVENLSDDKLNLLLAKMSLSKSIFQIVDIKYFYSFIMFTDTKKDCIVFISSHGNEAGICSDINLKPYPLIHNFNLSNYSNIVIYFGQCYSGIYNFIPLDKWIDKSKKKIVISGASGFYPSLSTEYTINFTAKAPERWIANTFLINLFNWFSDRLDIANGRAQNIITDIDSDSLYTVMDSFKYGATMTDNDIQKYKIFGFYEASIALIKYYKKRYFFHRILSKILNTENKLEKEAKKSIYTSQLVHEPWILNALIANEMNFIS